MGIQHMFYAYYTPLSEKYTGFRWRKLSFVAAAAVVASLGARTTRGFSSPFNPWLKD
jgi:hypothetical protein